MCALRNVKIFIGVFYSDLIPHSITRSGCLILNADPHTQKGSHWLALYLLPKAYTGFFFDSYCLPPTIPSVQYFLQHTCPLWTYNKLQLQGLTSTVCGKYCCLLALYMHRRYTPKQFVGLFDARIADTQVNDMFQAEFGSLRSDVCGGQCWSAFYKR
jgi:hypothetical protein